jgi:peptidoglycan lytic transglycosylase G
MVEDLDLAWEEQYRSHRSQRGGRRPQGRPSRGRSRRDKGRGKRSFGTLLVSLIMLAALGAGVYVGVRKVQQFFSAPDYTTTGTQTVTIEVKDGDSATDIGNTLFRAGVVKSAKAFVKVASADPRSVGIQVGHYKMFTPMPAKDALAWLLAPEKSRVVNGVTIPEGMITTEIFKRLSTFSGIAVADFVAAGKDPTKLGVPASWFKRDDGIKAAKTIEGFLFPDTYEFPAGATAQDMLKAMVARFFEVADDLDIPAEAVKLKLSPYEVLITASIAQVEAVFKEDMPKVSEVLYNRLYSGEFDCNCLQIDSAVNYWLKLRGKEPKASEHLTEAQLHDPKNPYNTHDVAGLPIGPISNPGRDALDGALHPVKSHNFFFVSIDKEGHMAYAETPEGHQANVEKACKNGIPLC